MVEIRSRRYVDILRTVSNGHFMLLTASETDHTVTGRCIQACAPVASADSHRGSGEKGGKKRKAAGLPQTSGRAQTCSPGQCAELAAYI